MRSFIERFEENVKKHPDKAALRSYGQHKGVSTYASLDRRSAMVYRYLKERGIGKEDYVMICLPRSIRTAICMMGILKAGAAFVIVEDHYAKDRIDFIYSDCGCVLKADLDVFEEMMQTEPLYGHEETDAHDAAYAVYTSGTTGNPKGVIHEYGNLIQCMESVAYNGKSVIEEDSIFALIAPLNFVASVIVLIGVLSVGATVFVVPYGIVKDFEKLSNFLMDEKITDMFMTASYIRLYTDPSPYLRTVYVSSEPANGLFLEGPRLLNLHAMSETGYATTIFELDRAYDPAPIGKPQFDLKVLVLDEDGKEVPDGEIGEMCIENPYVRGYVNLPEKTAKSFRDGIFHTDDLVRKDENGNIIIVGRADDMIKINGNRIEPAEIEKAVKNALGLKTVVAKGFNDGRRAYICLYYLNGEADAAGIYDGSGLSVDQEELRETLLKTIPYYMVPTYYVGMESFPLNPNGKLAKKMLKPPQTDSFRKEYEAPETETEKRICEVFAKALGVEKVGRNEDFYLIGGDSLSAITAIAELDLPGLTITDIYDKHTPAGIAEVYEAKYGESKGNAKEENERAMREERVLHPEQLYVLDSQFIRPKSTMWNLSMLFRLQDGVDADRLADAVDEAVLAHPAMLTELIFNEDSDVVQRYEPSLFEKTEVMQLTEAEFEEMKETLVKPYRMIGSRLYRTAVFVTEESSYLFLDMHHIISDGTSLQVFFGDVLKKYDKPDLVLEKDYYYLSLKEYERAVLSDRYTQAREHFKEYEDRHGVGSWKKNLIPDHETGRREMGCFVREIPIERAEIEESENFKNLGGNVFFMTAAALSQAEYNEDTNAALQCVVNGRDEAAKMNEVGLLYRTVCILLDFNEFGGSDEIVEEVKAQLNYGMANIFYMQAYDSDNELSESENFLYQKDIYSLGELERLVAEEIEFEDDDDASDSIFEIELIDSTGEEYFTFLVEYDASMYEGESVERYFRMFCDHVKKLIG